MTDPAPNPTPELSILTVNYRGASALLEAQRRLAAMPPACSFEWIVVNHSPEEGIAPCRAIARHVRVIDEPNLGFAAGEEIRVFCSEARDPPPLKFSNRGCQGAFLRDGRLAGFRVLSAVCRIGRRMLASDGGSAEVVHALVTA